MSIKKIVLIIFIIVLVVVSFYLAYAAGKKTWPFGAKYQAVALESGEIYFGNLSLFPSPKLSNAWMPQQTQGEKEEVGLQLVPVSSSYFAPENILYLNKDKILWWTDLSEESQVVQVITGKAQEKVPADEATQPQTTPQPETETEE